VLIGSPIAPLPAPAPLVQSIKSIEVTNTDEGRDGFEITFGIGRSGPASLLDYDIMANPLLRENNRVILVAYMGFTPYVLIDGIIRFHQSSIGGEPGQSTFKITGEDISCIMGLEERTKPWPNTPTPGVVASIVSNYAKYGIKPLPIPPALMDVPIVLDRTPMQRNTDLDYIHKLARSSSSVFYVEPDAVPGTTTAYWGPPSLGGFAMEPLNVNMGADTNVVGSINFQNNPVSVTLVRGSIIDRTTGARVPIMTFTSTRPPLSTQPAWLVNQPNVRTRQYTGDGGVNMIQAMSEAQSETDRSVNVLTGTGEIDATRYGSILRARRLVQVRGTGYQHDGLYYVKSVTHKIKRGEYKQSFVITREGYGSTIPGVI